MAGSAFILEALYKRKIPAPQASETGPRRVEEMVVEMAKRAFADLLCSKVEEAMEQSVMYG